MSAHQVLRLPAQPAFSEATRRSAVRGSPGEPEGKTLGPGAQVPPRGARGRGQRPQRRHRQGTPRGAETTSAALTAAVAPQHRTAHRGGHRPALPAQLTPRLRATDEDTVTPQPLVQPGLGSRPLGSESSSSRTTVSCV